MIGVNLDPKRPPPVEKSGGTGRAGPGEGIKDKITGPRKTPHKRAQDIHRLLGGMRPIARIHPVLNVRDRLVRPRRIALGENIGRLMTILSLVGAGRIPLLPHDLPHNPQARGLPRRRKARQGGPSAKTDRVAVRLHRPRHRGEDRKNAAGVVVIGEAAPVSVAIVHEVGRIGYDKID